jgi:hypothetical protein
MKHYEGSAVRVLFLICLIASLIVTYYTTMVLHDFEILTNENGVPDIEINYDS